MKRWQLELMGVMLLRVWRWPTSVRHGTVSSWWSFLACRSRNIREGSPESGPLRLRSVL